jgi:DNA-binding transcriptional LysR family regulator
MFAEAAHNYARPCANSHSLKIPEKMSIKKLRLEELDWDDLRMFLAVSRAGNLSQAAKQSRVDHSTISRRLAKLELCLGGPLFERRKDGLRRTALAERILPQIETMEGGAIALRENLGSTADKLPSGVVRVAMMEGIGSMYVARRIVPLSERYPQLRIELVTSPQLVNVSRREADIFLSFFKPTGRGLDCENIGSFALSLYGSQTYFDRFGEPRGVCELEHHHFMNYVDDLVQVESVRWLDEVIATPTVSFYSNSMLAQMAAAASGMGLVLLPRFAVINENELRPVLFREVVVHRELWLSVHVDLRYSTRIKAVLGYLKEVIAKDIEFLGGA